MEKMTLLLLVTDAKNVQRNVLNAIKTTTAEKPLVLFDKDKVNSTDEDILNFPYSYTVTDNNDYVEGAIWKVEGNEVVLFLTGESWGELYYQNVNDLPFESQIEILKLIAERL